MTKSGLPPVRPERVARDVRSDHRGLALGGRAARTGARPDCRAFNEVDVLRGETRAGEVVERPRAGVKAEQRTDGTVREALHEIAERGKRIGQRPREGDHLKHFALAREQLGLTPPQADVASHGVEAAVRPSGRADQPRAHLDRHDPAGLRLNLRFVRGDVGFAGLLDPAQFGAGRRG